MKNQIHILGLGSEATAIGSHFLKILRLQGLKKIKKIGAVINNKDLDAECPHTTIYFIDDKAIDNLIKILIELKKLKLKNKLTISKK